MHSGRKDTDAADEGIVPGMVLHYDRLPDPPPMPSPSAPFSARRFLTTALLAALAPIATAAVEPEDVSPAWSHTTSGPIFSSPTHADGELYIGSDDRHLHALETRTGSLRWTRALPHAVRSQPWVDEDAVLVVSGNTLTALSRATGDELWAFAPDDARGTTPTDRWDYHTSSPVCTGGVVYYGGGNGAFYAIDRQSGAPKFTFETDGASAIRSKAAIADGVAFFGDWEGVLYAVDTATGQLRWKQPTVLGTKPYPNFGGAVSAVKVHEGRLYFGLRNPEVLCLDAHTGARVWTFTAENGSWVAGTPVLDAGTVYITGSDDHRVHALDTDSGAERWFCDVGQNMFLAPLVTGDHLIVGDANSYTDDAGAGRLHVINRATGRIERTITTGGNVGTSSPVLADGRVILGSEDGRVLAYHLSDLISVPRSP